MPEAIALTRADLTRLFPNDPKAVRAFEALFYQAGRAENGVTAAADATQSIKDATVVTLSSNDEFGNERLLAVDPNTLSLTDNGPGGTIIIALVNNVQTAGGFSCTLNLAGNTILDLPTGGRLITDDFSGLIDAIDDAAAAAAGVPVGRLYRTASAVKVRVS